MPRDGKGKPFGIGDTVRVVETGVEFVVSGFVVSAFPLSREKIEALAKDFYEGTHIYNYVQFYWHEVELAKKNEDIHRDEDVAEHTDLCYADVAQKDGLEVPAEREFVVQMAIASEADKAVWGS